MTKKCSIIPQILSNKALVDSIAFSRLWDKAKSLYTDSVIAREKAKEDYYNLFQPHFKNTNGDWDLLYRYNNNIMTDEDKALFTNKYNDNIDLLKSNIRVPLDINGEPVIDAPMHAEDLEMGDHLVDRWINTNSDFISSEDQLFFNRVASQIIINKLGTLVNLKNKDISKDDSIRQAVLNELGEAYKINENENLLKLIEDIQEYDSFTWEVFLGYFKNKHNYQITDDSTFDGESGFEGREEIKKDFDDQSQLQRDNRLTVAVEIKESLAKSAMINHSLHDAKSESYSKKFDMNMPLDIDDIWHKLLSINYQSYTKDDVLRRLTYESQVHQNGALSAFINDLNTNDNLWNLFSRTVLLAITPNTSLMVKRDLKGDGTKAEYGYRQNNRRSDAKRIADNILRNSLEHSLKNSGDTIEYKDTILKNSNGIHDIFNNTVLQQNRLNLAISKLQTFTKSMGIDISTASIMFYINHTLHTNYDYTNLKNTFTELSSNEKSFKDIYGLISEINSKFKTIADSIVYTEYKKKRSITNSRKFNLSKDAKGALSDISFIVAMDHSNLASMSYYSSTGDKEQSPQYNSFVTDFFKGLNIGNVESRTPEDLFKILKGRFEDYFKDARLDYDNFLWSKLGKDNKHIERGLFFYKLDSNGRKVPTNIDKEVFKSFVLEMGDGNIDINNNSGIKYRDIKDDLWNLTYVIDALNGKFNIPIADSGRNHKVSRPFEHFEGDMSYELFNKDGSINTNFIKENSDDFRVSRIYRYAYNNLMQDITDINLTFNKIFDLDSYKEGTLKLNDEYKDNESALIEQLESTVKENEDGTVTHTVIKDNKPVGSALKFSTLEYVKNGKKENFGTFLESKGYNYLQFIVLDKDIKGHDTLLNNLFEEFLQEWLVENQKQTVESFKYIREDILNATSTANIKDDMVATWAEDSELSFVDPKSEYLIKRAEEKNYKSDIAFGVTAMNLFLNDHFNTIAFGNMLYGSVNEYKHMVDFNKRANQTTRNGSSTISNREYTQLIVEDIRLKDHMIDIFKANEKESNELNIITDRFKGLINTSDAFNIITEEEYVRRLKDFGVYDRYSKMIDDINSDKPFDPNTYTYLVEQLKYFSYERKFVKGRMTSIQNKNSTMVLFKRFTKGTEMGDLYDIMKDKGIDDINFRSAHKKGGVTPYMIHDPKTGKLDIKKLRKSGKELYNSTIKLNVSNLRIQLETVPHILNTKNTIPTQVLKKILDGLDTEAYYNSNGTSIKGRTKSYKDGERGIFENYQYALTQNVEHAALVLLNKFGAVKDGKILRDPNTNSISVNIPKLIKTLENYFIEQANDMNLIKAVKLNKNNESNVPLHYPTILKLIESVLEADITNNITKQKISGIHAPIMPGIFLNPSIDKTTDDTYVTYTKEFKEQIEQEGGVKLRSEYPDKSGKYHPAQIVLNAWDKRFYKPEYLMDDGSGRIDIDKIKAADPKLLMMYGTRIPCEGKQSSFVAEVVGFMQTGSSQVITPDHLVMRTGWDYDIDTVYLYNYTFDDELKTFDYLLDDKLSINRRLDKWAKLHYPDQYREHVTKSIAKIKELNAAIQSVNDKYNPEIDKFIDAKIDKGIEVAEDIIYKFNNEIATNPNLSDERLDYLREGILKKEALKTKLYLLKYNEEDIDEKAIKKQANLRKEEYGKLDKHIHELIRTRRSMIQLYLDVIEKNKVNVKYWTEFKESKRSEFEKLDQIQQATKEERDNIIVDSFIAIMANPVSRLDMDKPNEVSHIESASNFVNKTLGIDNSLAMISSISDKLRFRNLNMNIATLKEMSVAYDNTLSIMSILGGRINNNKVSAVLDFNEIKGFTGTFSSIEKTVNEVFGKDNYTYNNVTRRLTIKNIGIIGNNHSQTYTDIQGERISEQRSELTANILDAVSKLMINLTADTFPIFAFLSSTPLSHFTNITGKEQTNRFIYPSLFISQPAVQEMSRSISLNNKSGDTNSKYSFNIIQEKYLKNIINDKLEEFINYAFTKSKQVSFKDLPFEFIEDYNNSKKAGHDMEDANDVAAKMMQDLQASFKDVYDSLIKYRKTNKLDRIDINLVDHFISRNLELGTILGDPNTITELNDFLKKGIRLDSSKYNNALKVVESYDDMLDEYLDKGIDETPLNESFKEANEYIKYYNENIVAHSVTQLNVLAHYEKVELASNDVKSTMGIFNTDKLGAGPTSSVSNNLFNKIVNFETTLTKFKTHMLLKSDEDAVEAFEQELSYKVSLKDKIDCIYEYMNMYKYTPSAAMVNAKGVSLTRAVYGEAFDNDVDPNVLNSEYPYLLSQLVNTNILSTNLYSNVILPENHDIKGLLNNLEHRLKLTTFDNKQRTTQRYKILTYLINQKANNIKFFKNTDSSKILSTVKLGWTEEETDKGIIRTYDIIERETTNINEFNARIGNEQLSYFKSLNLVNQIQLLKSIGTYNQFLNRINVLSDDNLIKELGYVKLSVYDTDAQVSTAQVNFKNMYQSNNIFDRIVAQNLIKYTFLTNGLQFGSNIAKFIPIELIFDKNETHPDDTDNDLHELENVIRYPDFPVDTINDFVEYIHQASSDNIHMNPVMEPIYFYDEKSKSRKVRYDSPTFKKYMNNVEEVTVTDALIAEHIIVEKEDIINNSKYANLQYLIKPVDVSGFKYNILYKKATNSRDGYVFYYPIVKTLPFEYGSTDIELYKSLPDLLTNNIIYNANDYETEIRGSTLEIEREFPVTTSDDIAEDITYTTTVKTAINKSDVVLFIGTKDDIREKIVKQVTIDSGKKYLSISIDNFINYSKDDFNIYSESDKSILLIGNSSLELTNNQDSDLRRNINKLIKANAIEQVNIIGTKGFEAIVAKTNLKVPLNIEGKTMYATNLDTSTVYSENTDMDTYISLINEIKRREIDILSIATEFKKSLNETNVENRKDLTSITDRSRTIIQGLDPVETSYDALLDVTEANKGIYDFVMARIEDLADNVLYVEPGKYSEDTEANYNKILSINDELVSLYNHIFMALHSVSLPLINESIINSMIDIPDAFDMFIVYNANVADLRDRIPELEKMKDATFKKIKEMQGMLLLRTTEDPSFVNATYNQVQNQLKKDGINEPVVAMTPAMIDEAIERMLNRNQDISFYQMKLDSRRDMYITLPDIVMKFYSEVHYKRYAKAAKHVRTFENILSKVYKNTNKDYDKDRATWFLSRFVTDEGTWIDEWDMEALSNKLSAIAIQVNNQLELREQAIQRNDIEQVMAITAIKDDLLRQRDALTTVQPIPKDSAEYTYYKKAFNSISERQRSKFEQTNNVIFKVKDNTLIGVSKLIPNDEFINKRYTNLSLEEKQFLHDAKSLTQTLISEVFDNKVVDRNFIPFKYKTDFMKESGSFIGYNKRVPESTDIDIHNERVYIKESRMLKEPQHPDYIYIGEKLIGEKTQAWNSRILKEVNKNREEENHFKSIQEIKDYNKKINKEYAESLKPKRNFDIGNLLNNFIDDMAQVAVAKDFEPQYRELVITLGSDEFKASNSKRDIHSVKSWIAGKKQVSTISGKATNIYEAIASMDKVLKGASRIQDRLDQAASILVRTTSMSTMSFNFKGGIANVLNDYNSRIGEALSGEHFDKKQLLLGTKDFMGSRVDFFKDLGKSKTTSFNIALMKAFGALYEDKTEGHAVSEIGIFGKGIRVWDTISYAPMNSGELFVQFSTMFSMLRSYKIIPVANNSQIMSWYQYLGDRRLATIKPFLSNDQYTELNGEIFKATQNTNNNTDYWDIYYDWIIKNGSNFTSEQKNNMDKALKDAESKAKAEFDKLETVRDQFELYDGAIRIKEGSFMTERLASIFLNKVRAVNHSMSGIYNTIDRNQIQDKMTGEIIMQFSKWIRPAFNRYFGAKYGKTQFSEATGTYRAGAYIELFDFLGTPFKNKSQFSGERSNSIIEAGKNIFNGYIEFIGNFSFYYNQLPNHKKANVWRALYNMMSIVGVTLMMYAISKLVGGDDDDKKKGQLAILTIYELSRLQADLVQTLPYVGWFSFYKQRKTNIVPAERTVTDVAKLIYYSMLYPFQDQDAREYQRGIYNGETKLSVVAKRLTPGLRQIQSHKHLGSSAGFYQMYSPTGFISNIAGN